MRLDFANSFFQQNCDLLIFLQAMKERKVEMRAKSTQSDSYLILQPEKKVQESDSVLQVSIEKFTGNAIERVLEIQNFVKLVF